MGTSFVSVDEGSARKIRTFQRTDGADTVEEWMYAESEPFLAAYTVSVTTAIATSEANSHLLQIMAGSTLDVGIRRITVAQMANGTTQVNQWQLVRLTTAGTGGTSYTPRPHAPGDSASGATAMAAVVSPNKGTEGVALGSFVVLTHATAATVGLNPIFDRQWALDRTKGLWIAAGTSNGIALKNITASASTTVHITVELVEAGWQ